MLLPFCSLVRFRFVAEFFFFFNDTATTEIYTLSLHDALPISQLLYIQAFPHSFYRNGGKGVVRSEEHTSELQSPCNLVCRLLLEKKTAKRLSEPLTTTSPQWCKSVTVHLVLIVTLSVRLL